VERIVPLLARAGAVGPATVALLVHQPVQGDARGATATFGRHAAADPFGSDGVARLGGLGVERDRLRLLPEGRIVGRAAGSGEAGEERPEQQAGVVDLVRVVLRVVVVVGVALRTARVE